MSCSVAVLSASGKLAIFLYTSPRPLLTTTPRFAKVSLCSSETSLKQTFLRCLDMIKSETMTV